ncbi:putative ankyrin [Planoprotostelium fungivorum]|uniref:Putative ankyrin n=1 Tax=Planoprotostelium fungivorum TaxID=1890364 RepID=A0A2P6N9M0_9EUKA|nr:putative ankyrin [Planoprotostelium fungivorum]
MANRIITSHDVTRVILRTVLNKDADDSLCIHENKLCKCFEHNIKWRKRFATIRRTCKLWRDIADSLSDRLTDIDMSLAVKDCKIDSIRYLLARTELKPSLSWILGITERSQDDLNEMTRLLLSDRVDPSADDNKIIIEAASLGYTEMVRLLLADPRVDPSAQDNEAFKLAVIRGHIEIVRVLLSDPRVDPSAEDNDAIRSAAQYGHVEIMRLLLSDDRVDPSTQDNYVIRRASFIETSSEMVRLLLAHPRVEPSAMDNMAIRRASRGRKS